MGVGVVAPGGSGPTAVTCATSANDEEVIGGLIPSRSFKMISSINIRMIGTVNIARRMFWEMSGKRPLRDISLSPGIMDFAGG